MTRWVVCDFETASACDLRTAGAWRYAEDPSTEILCLCFGQALDTLVYTWTPHAVGFDLGSRALMQFVEDPEVIFIAHNASFEKAIWRNIMVDIYGYPDIPNIRWADTQAVCAMRALPLGLDDAVRVLRLAATKDTAGGRHTIGLSKPDKRGYYDRSPESLTRVYSYCVDDVRAEAGLHHRLGLLPPVELEVWQLDQTINERGVRIDLDFVRQAQKVVTDASVPLLAEFAAITGGLKPGQVAKFVNWCSDNGLHVTDMKRETVLQLLGPQEETDDDADLDIGGDTGLVPVRADMPSPVRRALEIRQQLGSASIKKLARMETCTCADGRARGLLQYHGAHTGLWAGRLLQPQNFPRGTTRLDGEAPDPEVVVDAIMTGDHEYVRSLLGPPIGVVGSSLRHCIVPAVGRTLVAGDFAGIQARLVLALAGQHDKTALMASGENPYISMATSIFKEPVKKSDTERYTIGKSTVLGCGFQMGWQKFREKYCPKQTEEFAQSCITAYRKEWAPKVPEVWKGLEYAARETVWTKRPHESHGVRYQLKDDWLTARLPNGDLLWYYDPTPCNKLMPWSTDEEPAVCSAWQWWLMKTGRWTRADAFGGILTQHVVSRLARSLLVKAMLECERQGLRVILNVHDEIVCEPEAGYDWTNTVKQIMEDRPRWAVDMGVPVAAEVWQGDRYKK